MPSDAAASRFQSTPPARGATEWCCPPASPPSHFNPRPPRGGRRKGTCTKKQLLRISIHAPREGGDGLCGQSSKVLQDFNPRPPARGATHVSRHGEHSLLFQSTPPARGATLSSSFWYPEGPQFQSTPPARGATAYRRCCKALRRYFNPRPPRGGRLYGNGTAWLRLYFNPRPPRGGRQKYM